MQRHRWAIANIWFLTAHLCPVGPEYLIPVPWLSHYPHVGPWIPLARAWFISYFLGSQSSLGLYYYPVVMPCFTVYLRLRMERLYCFGLRSVFAASTSLVTLSSSQSFTAIGANLGSVSEPANFVVGSWMGWPHEIFYESCDCFVVMPHWVFICFSRLIVRVFLFVPLAG